MGACNFEVIWTGKAKDVNEAFNEAVQDALYLHGHDPYNGTISTTELKGELKDAPRFGTKACDRYLCKKIDKVNKWQCYAIEIKGSYAKKLKEHRGFKGRKGIKSYYFFGMAAC